MRFTKTKTQRVGAFDTNGAVERLDTGAELLGTVVDGALHLSDGNRMYAPSLPDTVGPAEDIVVTDHVCVLGGDDVSRLSSSFRHQATATVEEATRILRGPDDEYVSVLCRDGQLKWLDPDDFLRSVEKVETGVSDDYTAVSSAAGWTAIAARGEVHLFTEPTDGAGRQLTLDPVPDADQVSVTDLSFAGETLLIATTDGLYGFDFGGDQPELVLQNPSPPDTLSCPSRSCAFALWEDGTLLSVEPDGSTDRYGDVSHDAVHPTDGHALYLVESEDGAEVYRSLGGQTFEVRPESVRFRGDGENIRLHVENDSHEHYEATVRVESPDVAIDADQTEVSVPPFEKKTYQVATVTVSEATSEVSLRLCDSRGASLSETTLDVEYGTPEIEPEAELQEIDDGTPTFDLVIENTGDGITQIAVEDESEEVVRKTLLDGSDQEVVELTGGQEYKLCYGSIDPSTTATCTSVALPWPPDGDWELDCTVLEESERIRAKLQNPTGVEVHEPLDVWVGGELIEQASDFDLSRGSTYIYSLLPDAPDETVTVEMAGREVVEKVSDTVDIPSSLQQDDRSSQQRPKPRSTGVPDNAGVATQLDGGAAGRRKRQAEGEKSQSVSESASPTVSTEYVTPTGDRIEEEFQTTHAFVQRATVENDTDEAYDSGQFVRSGRSLGTVGRGETATFSRWLAVPTEDNDVPEEAVEVADSEFPLANPPFEFRQGRIQLRAAIIDRESGPELELEVEVNPTTGENWRVEMLELRIAGQRISDISENETFTPGKTRTVTVEDDALVADGTAVVTTTFSRVETEETSDLWTLAPVVEPVPDLEIEVEKVGERFSNRHLLTVESDSPVRVDIVVEGTGDKAGSGRTIVEQERVAVGPENAEIEFSVQGDDGKLDVEICRCGASDQTWNARLNFAVESYTTTWKSQAEELPTQPVSTDWIRESDE